MSAYSDYKCGAMSEDEYNDYCRWENARERALIEAEHEREGDDEP